MKKYLAVIILIASVNTQAQKIALKKGQQITIITKLDQDVDMTAMGMQMKNNSKTTGIFQHKDSNNENYITSYTLSKVNLKMDMMGQENKYDSEKSEDKDSEMGKAISEKIGKEVTVLVNKNTGKASLDIKTGSPEKQPAANPMAGLMDAFGSVTEEANVETVFFILPAGKKAGDSWTDSSTSTKTMKDVRTYTIKSVEKGVADVTLLSIMSGTTNTEMQGMQMEISLSVKTEGQIVVDTVTSLVKKRSNTANLTGNIEMMGQSIPIISKAVMTVDYQ